MTERSVLDLLAERYHSPEWALLRHVANGTGGHKSRTADAVALNLWPSRGMELHGFEVKSCRGDWLRELADPAKADEIATRCHRWWIVAADDSVVTQADLFPQAWGLMVVRDEALTVIREAPLREPAPLTWGFLAAVLRRSARAQRRPEPSPAAVRARGVDPVTPEDAARLRGRLERLKSTAARIGTDLSNALYDLAREERKASQAEDGVAARGGR